MFNKSIGRASRKELEEVCKELHSELNQKSDALNLKELQVARLTKRLKKMTSLYHELEQSVSDLDIEKTSELNLMHEEHEMHNKKLELMLVQLNNKNLKLTKKLNSIRKSSSIGH